jgi:hypothetical protein
MKMTGVRQFATPGIGNPQATSGQVVLAFAECEWRLPSGEDLISFALATGLAAGPLVSAAGEWTPGSGRRVAVSSSRRQRRQG